MECKEWKKKGVREEGRSVMEVCEVEVREAIGGV